MPRSRNSWVPSTIEWLERICSMRVEPDRGSPTMNIGAGSGSPLCALSSKNRRVKMSMDMWTIFSFSTRS